MRAAIDEFADITVPSGYGVLDRREYDRSKAEVYVALEAVEHDLARVREPGKQTRAAERFERLDDIHQQTVAEMVEQSDRAKAAEREAASLRARVEEFERVLTTLIEIDATGDRCWLSSDPGPTAGTIRSLLSPLTAPEED